MWVRRRHWYLDALPYRGSVPGIMGGDGCGVLVRCGQGREKDRGGSSVHRDHTKRCARSRAQALPIAVRCSRLRVKPCVACTHAVPRSCACNAVRGVGFASEGDGMHRGVWGRDRPRLRRSCRSMSTHAMRSRRTRGVCGLDDAGADGYWAAARMREELEKMATRATRAKQLQDHAHSLQVHPPPEALDPRCWTLSPKP